jgi:hypothetical protein
VQLATRVGLRARGMWVGREILEPRSEVLVNHTDQVAAIVLNDVVRSE